ncbi:MAG TPA: MBL fold metallo-hydrolase [Pyrinomonadaceae bacterium]|jgi:glyoxylase-like metal-dependent hydrolase (beta-lactamase superfamily II)|nr:MBL fold metallo-hydrolase [Pyrinomonadaceae bacterium]
MRKHVRVRPLFIIAVILLSCSAASAQAQKLEIVKIADGVYGAIFSEPRMDPVESNSLIVVGDDGVLVLDANRTPAGARAVIAEIRKLTDKPVRYVVNSHWHDDHIFGNQSYKEAFPQVEFVAHRNTREDMEKLAAPHIQGGVNRFTKALADAETQLSTGTKPDGSKLTDKEREQLSVELKVYKDVLPELKTIHLVLPTVTFDQRLTLYQGGREIQILYFGRGNTRGDVAVYLPRERVLATGDLLVHPVPFAYGSFLGEWIQAMKKLRELDAAVIVPGHGPLMRDKEYLDTVIALLESVTSQVQDAVKRGLTLEETRKAVNLESFRRRLAGDDAVRLETFDDSIIRVGIERAYKEAKGELK